MTDGMDTIVKSVKQVQVIFHQKSLIAVRRSRRALSEFELPIHPRLIILISRGLLGEKDKTPSANNTPGKSWACFFFPDFSI